MIQIDTTFVGSYDHKIDGKHRVSVPAKWREKELGKLWLIRTQRDEFEIIKGYTNEYFMSDLEFMRAFAELNNIDRPSLLNEISRRMRMSRDGEINTQGKLLVPSDFCTEMGIVDNEKLMIAGCGGYFEIWRKVHYDVYVTRPVPASETLIKAFPV